jgi:hypothetical protein
MSRASEQASKLIVAYATACSVNRPEQPSLLNAFRAGQTTDHADEGVCRLDFIGAFRECRELGSHRLEQCYRANVANVLSWVSGSGVVQGLIMGATFAYLTAFLIMNVVSRTITTTVNGWSSIRKCGQPGNGILVRAACAKALPVVNVFEEAAYWTTTRDGSGHRLSGKNDYVLHFPAGQLPPNDAFWSLTMTDVVGYMVNNPIGRSSFNDRSNLAKGADGSIDLYLQQKAPTGHEQNWLATPAGNFKLMLRAYLPGTAILNDTYRVPEIMKAH